MDEDFLFRQSQKQHLEAVLGAQVEQQMPESCGAPRQRDIFRLRHYDFVVCGLFVVMV